MNVRVIAKELLNPARFVSREIVGNDVNLFAAALVRYHIRQEGDEFLAGVVGRSGSQNLTCFGVQGCI